MLLIRKMSLSKGEVRQMVKELDGYVWAVMDTNKGMIAVGDEYVITMKNALLREKCALCDIFGLGLDLKSGEIDFRSLANIKWMDRRSTREVPIGKRERMEILIRYFFEELTAFKKRAKLPRYSKQIHKS